MTAADRFTVTIQALDLDTAQTLSETIESDVQLNPQAIAINEIGHDRWELVAYFGSKAEAEGAAAALGHEGAIVAPLADQDWVRQSLAGLSPVSAGRFFLYGSHDKSRRRAGGITIDIDAGTAFGTGHHGTTEGCLLALERLIKRQRPRRILDVGCGTGVLAIAAAKATRNKVVASDIDPEAVRVARHNALINSARPTITALRAAGLKHPQIHAKAPFDLIFANILARPLASLAHGLSRITAPGGALVLSGLTLDQCQWIAAIYRSFGLIPLSRIYRGEWATLLLTRPRKISETTRHVPRDRCGWRSRRRRPAPWHG